MTQIDPDTPTRSHSQPTDRDHYEPSPSTGWRETTIICGGELPAFLDDDRPEDLL